ncbi:MAG: transposase [Synechococcaceae cyanobacterium SM2_3_60]|nr:transposase [Synechococcaceae cyanobacterium SM2_3_60]
MSLRTVIRDEQWARIKDLLPGRSGSCGRTARDNRLFIEAVLYNYCRGILWRDLPEQYGDFRVIHTRMSRWAKAGVWAQVLADFEWALIDSTIVRAHQHRCKGGARSHRSQSRRVEHEDSCDCGWLRQAYRSSMYVSMASLSLRKSRCAVSG